MRFHRVIWQPPPHQEYYGPEHHSGHFCNGCSVFKAPQVVDWRLTAKAARRRAERLNTGSISPGIFYYEDDPSPRPEWAGEGES